MDLTRRAPQVGILACLCLLGSIVFPYVFLPEAAYTGLSVYYAQGIFGPVVVGVFATVTIVVFGGALGGRADPSTVAGAAIVLGLFLLLLSAQWALSVPVELVQGITTETWLDYHRWVVVALSGAIAVSAVVYTRSLGLL